MPGGNESEMRTSSVGGESTVIEHRGRMESADASNVTVIKDGESESVLVSERIVLEAEGRGEDFEVRARVAFTTPRSRFDVLSLERLDKNEGGRDGGAAAEEADQATKSA